MTQRGRRPTRERQMRPRPRVRIKWELLENDTRVWVSQVEFGRSTSKFATWAQAMEWANWLAEPTDRIPL